MLLSMRSVNKYPFVLFISMIIMLQINPAQCLVMYAGKQSMEDFFLMKNYFVLLKVISADFFFYKIKGNQNEHYINTMLTVCHHTSLVYSLVF